MSPSQDLPVVSMPVDPEAWMDAVEHEIERLQLAEAGVCLVCFGWAQKVDSLPVVQFVSSSDDEEMRIGG